MATAKKAVAKKAAAPKAGGAKKKATSAKKQKRVLARAEGPQCFWVSDGTIIADLLELERALAKMANEVFTYHVSKEKNDFADWVQYVLGDTELAGKMRTAKQPKTAQRVIVTRLKIYDI